jgi:hypothetical protein
LSHAGGQVEASGEQAACEALRAALGGDLGPDEAREHVHGFHSYPARMHPRVARRLVDLFAPAGGAVLDPFCGSGTVLVEARLAGRIARGVDLNPIGVELSRLKTRGAEPAEIEALVRAAARVRALADRRRRERAGATRRYPDVDTRELDPHVLLELDGLRDGIERVGRPETRRALLLVLSAILTKVGRRRGDSGVVAAEARRLAAGFTAELFERKAVELARRLRQYARLLGPRPPDWNVSVGDARALRGEPPGAASLVVTSPPYPGTYDYLAHHAARLRWLGLDASDLRKGEIGARRELGRLPAAVAAERFARDLACALGAVRSALRPDALAVVVMADTGVGRDAIRAAQLVRTAAETAGLAWVATASQLRPLFPGPGQEAFAREPRREHAVVLKKPRE